MNGIRELIKLTITQKKNNFKNSEMISLTSCAKKDTAFTDYMLNGFTTSLPALNQNLHAGPACTTPLSNHSKQNLDLSFKQFLKSFLVDPNKENYLA